MHELTVSIGILGDVTTLECFDNVDLADMVVVTRDSIAITTIAGETNSWLLFKTTNRFRTPSEKARLK